MSMLPYIFHQQMLPAAEQSVAMDTTVKFIGTLDHVPVKLILHNQSTSATVLFISLDGGGAKIQWKTFVAGEAMILDDDIYTFPKGAKFYGQGAATGNFSVSYTYINL